MKKAVLALVFVLGVGNPSLADSLDKEQLEVISEFADTLCGEYVRKRGSQVFKIDGEAEIRLKGLIKKLTDAGIAGAAELTIEEAEGFIEEDMLRAELSIRECKERVWNDLKHSVTGLDHSLPSQAPAANPLLGEQPHPEGSPLEQARLDLDELASTSWRGILPVSPFMMQLDFDDSFTEHLAVVRYFRRGSGEEICRGLVQLTSVTTNFTGLTLTMEQDIEQRGQFPCQSRIRLFGMFLGAPLTSLHISDLSTGRALAATLQQL